MAFAAPAALGGAIGGNAVIPGFLATTMIGTWAVGGQGSDDVVGLTGAMLSLGGATALTAVGMATGWKGAAIITLGAGLAAGWLDRPGQRQN